VERKCNEFNVQKGRRRLQFEALVHAAFRMAVERIRATIMNNDVQIRIGRVQDPKSTSLDRQSFPYFAFAEWNQLSEINATAAAQHILLRYSRGAPARFPTTLEIATQSPLSAMGTTLTTAIKAQVALIPTASSSSLPTLPVLNTPATTLLAILYGLSIPAGTSGKAWGYIGAIGASSDSRAYWSSVNEAFHGQALPPSPPATPQARAEYDEEEILDQGPSGLPDPPNPPTPGEDDPPCSQTRATKRRFEETEETPALAPPPPSKRARIEQTAVSLAWKPPLYASVESPLRLPWTPGLLALIRATLSLAPFIKTRFESLAVVARGSIKELQTALKALPGGEEAYIQARTFLMLFVINSRMVGGSDDDISKTDCIDALYGPPRDRAEEDDAMDLDMPPSRVAAAPTSWAPQILPSNQHYSAICIYMTLHREAPIPLWAMRFRRDHCSFFTGMRSFVSEADAIAVWDAFLSAFPPRPLARGHVTLVLYILFFACFGGPATPKPTWDWHLSAHDLSM
jgi:hypothetical protein